jgi:serine/threonine-protein kinase
VADPVPDKTSSAVTPDAESATTNSTASLIGTRLGDYQVMRKLGRGGMADVFLARQVSLGRDVALKVLRSDFARDAGYVERFRREARAAAKLNHPNIVQVYEVGSVDAAHYISQELIDGENLRQTLDRSGAIGLEDAIEVIVGVAAALEVASEGGITHRDIKPENIMRSSRGIIKVADFGLARLNANVEATRADLTQAGLTLGTPRYMSPEQVQGHSVDVRSDLYSLGVTMYHLLAGRPPFEADDPLALALLHLHETPPPLDHVRNKRNTDGSPDLPEWLIAVVARLMNKLPRDRFQSPAELLDAVRNESSVSNLGGFGVGTAAATIRLQRAADQARRNRRSRQLRWAATVLLPPACVWLGWQVAAARPARSVTQTLSAQTVARQDSVQEQFLHAAERDDEAGWNAIGVYFPAADNATNAAYHAKAMLQLARLFQEEGRLADADRTLESLLRDLSIDRVYQVLALARRCLILEQLNENRKMADARRELQSLYDELKNNNPEAQQLIDRILTPSQRLLLGISDS